ncbi:MAG: ABC transporter substrate-binding protein [Bosea sp.]|uniref:ABC transporter substrate-binding protein n=1 Tax=Bosea sp. (in: a-proteobacteria) TaxID=1871050 RepID=UPI001AC715C8|nr:ABC transporter substrate-binding protein [Bosea sp. (in: a-proteobacteria)]MBN9472218.1 ABC transporter substrate-binding protein [Bosea sp. (in: a-proteobacteria)]
MTIWSRLSQGIAVAASAAFLISAAQAQETLKVGALLPLSGNYGFLGVSERLGIDMAVAEVNAAGGVLGRKVEVAYEDAGTPAQATRKATQMLEHDKVAFFVNGGGSAVSAAMFEFAQRNKVINLAIDPNAEELVTSKANKYSFLVPAPSSMIANAVIPEAAKLGKTVMFLTHDYSFGHAQTAEQRRVFKTAGGVSEVGEIKVPLNTRDFSSQIIAIRNAKPDMLVVNVAGVDATALFEQIWEFELHKATKIVVPLLDFEDSWAIGPEKNQLIALAGGEWHYQVPAKDAAAFKEKYQQLYPKAQYPVPTTNAVNAYLGVRETLRAITRAGSTDTDKIVKALEDFEVKDALKPNPMVIRGKDHQWVQDFFVFRMKAPNTAKEPGDIYELVSVAKGTEIVVPATERKGDLSTQ